METSEVPAPNSNIDEKGLESGLKQMNMLFAGVNNAPRKPKKIYIVDKSQSFSSTT